MAKMSSRKIKVWCPGNQKFKDLAPDNGGKQAATNAKSLLVPGEKEVVQEIHFIDAESSSDPKQRQRQVRMLAMRSYHAKRRASATPAMTTTTTTVIKLNSPEPEHSQLRRSSLDSWSYDPFLRLPVDISPVTRELVHNIFTSDKPNVVLFRETQFAASVSCGASFYAAMANLGFISAVESEAEVQKLYYTDLEQENMTKALQLVRSMLSDEPDYPSEGMISAVGSLCTYSRLKGDKENCTTHRKALDTLVRLRGGIQTLSPDIRSFIFWCDQNTAYTWDQTPYFAPPPVLFVEPSKPISTGTLAISKKLRGKYPELENIITQFEEAAKFTIIYEDSGFPHTSSEYKTNNPLLALHLSRCYCLLAAQQDPNYTNESTIVSELLRLSLLIFMITMARVVAPRSSTTTEQMCKLKDILANCTIEWGDLQPLRAWIICIGYLEAEFAGIEVGWWRNMWEHCLDDFPKSGKYSILPSTLLQELSRENTWTEDEEKKNMFLGSLERAVLRVVEEIIWCDDVQGLRYREVLGRKLTLGMGRSSAT